MKKTLTKAISKFFILVMVLNCFCINAFANSSSIVFDNRNLCVDSILTAEISFSTSTPMLGLEGYITYDPTIIEFISGNNSFLLTKGKLKLGLEATGKTNFSETIKFKSLKSGKTTLSLQNVTYLNANKQEIHLADNSSTLTVPSHTYDNTCDSSCNRCGSTIDITHTYSYDCDKECNICGNIRTAEHNYDSDCDSTCNLCNANRSVIHKFGSWTTTKNATCTQNGNQRRICSNCFAFEDMNIEALGHSFSDPVITKKASCTQTGIETGICTRCKKETSNILPQTEHSFGEWTESLPSTCTDSGIMIRKCTVCNKEDSKSTSTLGHNFDVPVIVKEPTISSTGIKDSTCKRCGEIISEIIPCTTTDENTGIEIESDEGTFPSGISIIITPVTDNDNMTTISNILNRISNNFFAYNILAYLDGKEVQPNGKVKITLNIPTNFSNEVELYSIANGSATKLEALLSDDKKSITTEVEGLGTIAICDLCNPTTTDAQSSATLQKEPNNAWIFWLIIAFVLLSFAIIITFLVAKRKFSKQ